MNWFKHNILFQTNPQIKQMQRELLETTGVSEGHARRDRNEQREFLETDLAKTKNECNMFNKLAVGFCSHKTNKPVPPQMVDLCAELKQNLLNCEVKIGVLDGMIESLDK